MSYPASTFSEASRDKPLPVDWRWAELADICVVDKKLVEPESALAESLPYISLEHIESNTGRILRAPSEQVEDEGKSTTYLFDERHVLYGKLRPYLNKVALPNFRGRCTTELVPLLPTNGTDRCFLAWVLRRKETVDAAMSQKTGSRMPRADVDNLLTLRFSLPPPIEQRRLAANLNEQMAAIERARAAAEAQLEAAKDLPAAYLRSIFNSDEATQWVRKRLGDVALQVQNGIYKAAEHYGHGHPFLRMYNVQNDSWTLNLDPLALVNLEGKEEQTYALKRGDLLISRVNSFELVGKCAWVSPDAEGFVFENMLIRVQLDSSVNSLFAAQQMATDAVRKQIEAVAKRAIGQASINSTDLRGIEIALPSLAEQERMASELSAQIADAQKASRTLQDQLDTINKLSAALLREAFTGEL